MTDPTPELLVDCVPAWAVHKIAALEQDARRLDWLSAGPPDYHVYSYDNGGGFVSFDNDPDGIEYATLREAVDAAMAAERAEIDDEHECQYPEGSFYCSICGGVMSALRADERAERKE